MTSQNSRNIIFIGGIHGVGKSTICQQLSSKYSIGHLSASGLIKWAVSQEKKVDDIDANQDALIRGLESSVDYDKTYLLDGHYCLIDSESRIARIPELTFKKINPKLFVMTTADVEMIYQRLHQRDGAVYPYSIIEQMQREEKEYAKALAHALGKPLIMIDSDNLVELEQFIEKQR